MLSALFTTAAFAFAAGANSITLVSTVEEAKKLRDQIPNSLAMGEAKGLPPEGFDLGNSPSALVGVDLKNCHLIQRTSAGTQGAVNSSAAENLLASVEHPQESGRIPTDVIFIGGQFFDGF